MADSLKRFGFRTIILVCDENPIFHPTDLEFMHIDDLALEETQILKKKYGKKSNAFRWGLKPVFVKHLLTNSGFNKVIYVDNDICFFANPMHLFELLQQHSILLTPHFYEANTEKNQSWLEANFRIGLYNAGFIGVNQDAIEMLDWWRKACVYAMKKAFWRGLYDDQKYLDLVPILFDKTYIIKEYGHNLASWNERYQENKLKEQNDQVVFIHFTPHTIQAFKKSENTFKFYFDTYSKMVEKRGFDRRFLNKRNWRLDFSDFIFYMKWRLVRIFEK